jgi:hypothetical protein
MPCAHVNLYSGNSHKTQNMCSRIMVIKYRIHLSNHIKNKWSTINNTTIYIFNNASKDNVRPYEIIIYYVVIPTLTNNPQCITSKLNTIMIHDVMMRAFKWSIIIQKKNWEHTHLGLKINHRRTTTFLKQ